MNCRRKKLAALLVRRKARDLFDGSLVFSIDGLDIQRLRTVFAVYGAIDRKDWRTVSATDVVLDEAELYNQLLPALQIGQVTGADAIKYGNYLVDECRNVLAALLPFNDAERDILNLLLDKGEVDATVLTDDIELHRRIQVQPLLEWKAQHVRRFKGLHD